MLCLCAYIANPMDLEKPKQLIIGKLHSLHSSLELYGEEKLYP